MAVGATLALSAGSAKAAGADGSAPRSAWRRQYGGDGDQEANALVQTSDGGYALAGGNEDRAWLVKLRSNGEVAWQRTLDDAGSVPSLVEAHDGGFVLGAPGGGGDDDTSVTILVKVDASGAEEWRAGIPFPSGFDQSEGELLPDAVVRAEGGGYVAAGYTAVGRVEDFLPDLRPWAVKVGEDGELARTRTYLDGFGVAEAIVPLEGGGYVVGGTTTDGTDRGHVRRGVSPVDGRER